MGSFTTSVMVGSNENGEALVYHVIRTLLLSDHTSMPRNALVRGSFRMGLSTAEFVKVCKIVVHSGRSSSTPTHLQRKSSVRVSKVFFVSESGLRLAHLS